MSARWAPRHGESRQSDRSRANARARRLRRNLTPTEKRLWRALRILNREGAQLRRQVALDDWVFDFGDLSTRLLIEVDGGVHERLPDIAERDARKSAWADANNFRLLRFSNRDVWGDLDTVMTTVRSVISDPRPLPAHRKGEGESDAFDGR